MIVFILVTIIVIIIICLLCQFLKFFLLSCVFFFSSNFAQTVIFQNGRDQLRVRGGLSRAQQQPELLHPQVVRCSFHDHAGDGVHRRSVFVRDDSRRVEEFAQCLELVNFVAEFSKIMFSVFSAIGEFFASADGDKRRMLEKFEIGGGDVGAFGNVSFSLNDFINDGNFFRNDEFWF